MRWAPRVGLRRAALITAALLTVRCTHASLDLSRGGSPVLGLAASAGMETVTVSWDAASSVEIVLLAAPGDDPACVSCPRQTVSTSPASFTGLAGGAPRFARARVGSGPWSDPVEATPIAKGNRGLAPLSSPAWTGSGASASFRFGFPVAAAGDVNGDGFDDLLVGEAWLSSASLVEQGGALLFLGRSDGLDALPAWSVVSTNDHAHFGKALAGAGDVNADGHPDVLVGGSDFTDPETFEGFAALYLGSGGTYAVKPAFTVEGDQANAYLGRFVGGVGDVNGDGIDDFAVSEHGFDGTNTDSGRVLGVYGNASTFTMGWLDNGFQAGGNLGYALAKGHGDADHDGSDDVLVGAFRHSNSAGADSGRTYLYKGSASGVVTGTIAWSADGVTANATFGSSVAWAGDVNGDGHDDVIVGAPGATYPPQIDPGAAYLFLGNAADLDDAPAWEVHETGHEQLGAAVAGAGDVNGDGYADVLVGAYGAAGGAGRVDLYYGGPAGLGSSAVWSFTGDTTGRFAGGSLAGLGDVNADGAADFAVGTEGIENTPVPDPRAWVFFGPPKDGPAITVGAPPAITSGTAASLDAATVSAPGFRSAPVCTVDWGDGTAAATIPACDTAALRAAAHTWTSAGTVTIHLRVSTAYGLVAESLAVVSVQ